MTSIKKFAQGCQGGTRQILKVFTLNYRLQQTNTKIVKIQDGGRPPFYKSFLATTQQRRLSYRLRYTCYIMNAGQIVHAR